MPENFTNRHFFFQWIRRRPWSSTIIYIAALLVGLGSFHSFKSLPPGLSYIGASHPVEKIRFLRDITWIDPKGVRHHHQEIFDEILRIIRDARHFILVDMFLFNDYRGAGGKLLRPLSSELTDTLVKQKQQYPEIQIVVITDPINTVYGGLPAAHLERLASAGIEVSITRLEKLRDSNPLYSAFWRLFGQVWGNSTHGWLPNPFGRGRVSLRSYLRLANFKANHRKVLIADDQDSPVGLITSANPHDGSSAHGNVAIEFKGTAVYDLLASEQAVLQFSGGSPIQAAFRPGPKPSSETSLQVATEGKIKTAILDTIKKTGRGDQIDLAMFYLSDREVVNAFKNAHHRGVALRILLDPNKDAFGRVKNGIPNRQVAHELVKTGIAVKWSHTHGEQSHAKMMLTTLKNEGGILILGSANFTRRNLGDLNLETDAIVRGRSQTEIFRDAHKYFELMWHNSPQRTFSIAYPAYQDDSLWRIALYRFMEAFGTSTF